MTSADCSDGVVWWMRCSYGRCRVIVLGQGSDGEKTHDKTKLLSLWLSMYSALLPCVLRLQVLSLVYPFCKATHVVVHQSL